MCFLKDMVLQKTAVYATLFAVHIVWTITSY